MNRQHTRTAAVAAAATCLLLAACSAPATSSQPEISVPQQSSVSEMEWSACPDGVENPADGPARLQCASVPVPVDPDDPDGRQIDIMISRLPSQKPEQRRGVLLLNPGGPGGTGLDQPRFLADRGIPQSVLDSYDLIGMDTRGVGHSSPISCGFTDDLHYYGAVPPYAYDQAAFDEQVRTAREVARRCAADDDGMLRHVSTANMARDLDRIRAALGEDTASFLGYSYGSALGAAYASMFPDSTDRIVLDSNIGDTHLDRDGMRRYARGMEDTFPDFARWVSYRDGLAAGVGGDLPVGAPILSAGDNAWSVFLAVTCNDVEWPHEVSTYEQAVAADRVAYPLFGAAAANIMPCAFWESVPAEPPVTIDTEGPTNILIAQHRRDPVTPMRGGELLDERFGQRSRLLTVDGSGHGVFGLGTNPCAQRVVTEYLVDGAMPEEDTTCPVGP